MAGRFGRWLGVGALVTVTAAGGCALGKKPYAADPLLERRRGVWGDWEKAAPPGQLPAPEPTAPPPPDAPLVGSPLLAENPPEASTSPAQSE